jgi:hypothetical protein
VSNADCGIEGDEVYEENVENPLLDQLDNMGVQVFLSHNDYDMYKVLYRTCRLQGEMAANRGLNETWREEMFKQLRSRYDVYLPRQLFILNEDAITKNDGCANLFWTSWSYMRFDRLQEMARSFALDLDDQCAKREIEKQEEKEKRENEEKMTSERRKRAFSKADILKKENIDLNFNIF